MSEASISVDVLVSHAFYGEAFPRGGTTSFRIDLIEALNSVRHGFEIARECEHRPEFIAVARQRIRRRPRSH